jgi:hypothetical protein
MNRRNLFTILASLPFVSLFGIQKPKAKTVLPPLKMLSATPWLKAGGDRFINYRWEEYKTADKLVIYESRVTEHGHVCTRIGHWYNREWIDGKYVQCQVLPLDKYPMKGKLTWL